MFRYMSMVFRRLDSKILNGPNHKMLNISNTRKLTKLTEEQTKNFLNSFDIVLSDCDGVLWHINKPIPGAVNALKRLQEMGKSVYLVTNNSTLTTDAYCERVRQQGLTLQPEHVINTAKVIAWYLNKINFVDEAFVIGCKVFREVLAKNGIKLAAEHPGIDEANHSATIKALEDVASVRAVVIDFSFTFDWAKVAFAISCLRKKDVLYLTGVEDEWITCGHNKKVIGNGPLINVITKHSGRTPIKCAKPSTVLKDYVLESCRVQNPKRCLFIGDTVSYDMAFATMCGFQKLFVLSGLEKMEDVTQSETSPDFYISNLGMMNAIINSVYGSAAEGKSS